MSRPCLDICLELQHKQQLYYKLRTLPEPVIDLILHNSDQSAIIFNDTVAPVPLLPVYLLPSCCKTQFVAQLRPLKLFLRKKLFCPKDLQPRSQGEEREKEDQGIIAGGCSVVRHCSDCRYRLQHCSAPHLLMIHNQAVLFKTPELSCRPPAAHCALHTFLLRKVAFHRSPVSRSHHGGGRHQLCPQLGTTINILPLGPRPGQHSQPGQYLLRAS